MLSQSNEVRTQATERLFLAVVNQAILDVLARIIRVFETRKASFMVQSRCLRRFCDQSGGFRARAYHDTVCSLPRNF